MKNTLFTLVVLILPLLLQAQGSGVPLNSDSYHIMDRLEIKTGIESPFHSAMKYYTRGEMASYARILNEAALPLTSSDRRDLYYIFKDNNEWLAGPLSPTTVAGEREKVTAEVYDEATESYVMKTGSQAEMSILSDHYVLSKKPLLKYFYKTPANFYELNEKYFQLKVNPVLNIKLAKEQDDPELIFYNQRGIDIRGAIDDRVYFYTNILETQARYPNYVNQLINQRQSIPGAGFYKKYKSSLLDITKGFDYLNAQGYIGFNVTRHIGVQMGHGQHFIGNGYRSFFLSDFGTNYFYLKLNTRVWKFHYQNIFTELAAQGVKDDAGDQLIPKKYMTAHYLSYKINPKLSVGIFETVVFSRENYFELQYLNPLILYRTVEGYIGSPDNVLIGLDVKWNFLKRFQFYSQLMMDEFKYKELFVERRGAWTNKYAVQAGLKYINAFGIDHLDLQVEMNIARPYTFTHRDTVSNYAHYNQPLAHPLGANFSEFLFNLRYQPIKKLMIDARVMRFNTGEDSSGDNWGGNILLPNTDRVQNYGNEITQGIYTETLLFALDLSYQIRHNIYFDLHYQYRNKDSELDGRDQVNTYFGGGIRMNMTQRRLEF